MVTNKSLLIFLATLLLSVSFILYWRWDHSHLQPTTIRKIEEVFPEKRWASLVPNVSSIRGIEGWKAKDCGSCHTEIYEEWKNSTHAYALHDLQFQSELSKPNSPAWLCLNCHIPMQNQREYIVLGLENGDFRKPVTIPNPGFIPELREEGVTCGTCHIRTLENGESVILGANGNYSPPHPVLKDPSALRNRCLDCHNAEYVLDKDLICYFQTGKEMQESPHIRKDQTFCHSCHLPSIQRSIVKPELKKPIRTSHRHTFWGGGIPKTFESYQYLKDSGFEPSFHIKKITTTQDHNLVLTIQNKNKAHKLPTGDPERYISIEIQFHGSNHEVIHKDSYRIGQVWEWWPEAKLLQDNRLGPLEERQISIPITSYYGKDISHVDISVYYVRLSEENLNSMKKNYNQVNPKYQDKIQNMDKYYPTQTHIYQIHWTPQQGIQEIRNWKDFLPSHQ